MIKINEHYTEIGNNFGSPDKMTSWEFFDLLLNKTQVVGTPGSGFGQAGERFFRFTAFGKREETLEAIERMKKLFA